MKNEHSWTVQCRGPGLLNKPFDIRTWGPTVVKPEDARWTMFYLRVKVEENGPMVWAEICKMSNWSIRMSSNQRWREKKSIKSQLNNLGDIMWTIGPSE